MTEINKIFDNVKNMSTIQDKYGTNPMWVRHSMINKNGVVELIMFEKTTPFWVKIIKSELGEYIYSYGKNKDELNTNIVYQENYIIDDDSVLKQYDTIYQKSKEKDINGLLMVFANDKIQSNSIFVAKNEQEKKLQNKIVYFIQNNLINEVNIKSFFELEKSSPFIFANLFEFCLAPSIIESGNKNQIIFKLKTDAIKSYNKRSFEQDDQPLQKKLSQNVTGKIKNSLSTKVFMMLEDYLMKDFKFRSILDEINSHSNGMSLSFINNAYNMNYGIGINHVAGGGLRDQTTQRDLMKQEKNEIFNHLLKKGVTFNVKLQKDVDKRWKNKSYSGDDELIYGMELITPLVEKLELNNNLKLNDNISDVSDENKKKLIEKRKRVML